jgi:transposase-like protein
MERYTIFQFNEDFPDEEACLGYVAAMVYPSFPVMPCRVCDVERTHHKLKTRKAYSCQKCGTHIYPLAGTIFEKSRTPLKSWFYAMYLVASTRSGISAKQLERELGVTYKTAWRMFKQIRTLMADDSGPLKGTVEADETFFGGKPRYSADVQDDC